MTIIFPDPNTNKELSDLEFTKPRLINTTLNMLEVPVLIHREPL